jgi:hypothetical protein
MNQKLERSIESAVKTISDETAKIVDSLENAFCSSCRSPRSTRMTDFINGMSVADLTEGIRALEMLDYRLVDEVQNVCIMDSMNPMRLTPVYKLGVTLDQFNGWCTPEFQKCFTPRFKNAIKRLRTALERAGRS